MGVVSGITMSFQFGTNWPGFMETVGNIAGPLLAYEVLTAFFLEATVLGIMLFGFSRVPGWMNNLATFLVAFGTTASAFWILVLNSWMHTPVGFEMRDGVAHATDWLRIIFNPSFPYDPKTVERVVEMTACPGPETGFNSHCIKADHFERVFGEGVRLKSITVEMTKEETVWTISAFLPWLKNIEAYIDGQRYGGGPELSNILNKSDFIVGEMK